MPKKKKDEEESELEEEVEEKPEIDTEKLNELLETQPREESESMPGMPILRGGSPSLERMEIGGEPVSLEDQVELAGPVSKKKDDKVEYEKAQDPSDDYQDPSKNKEYQEGVQAISAQSHVDMQSLGRGPERMGREFQMSQPDGMETPQTVGDYHSLEAKKSDDFKGEKTNFQEQLERRYQFKK